MGKKKIPSPRKRAVKARKAINWHLPHLMVAAGIIVALAASIPVGAYLKASVLIAQDAGGQLPPPPPPENQPLPPPPENQLPPPPPQMMSCPDGSQVPQGTQCPQPTVCPTGMTGTPPNCMAPVVQTNTGNTGTYMCNGAQIPNGTPCTTVGPQSNSTMSEAQMQAGCVAANGQWMGMSVMPSCQMPGMTSMQPCATGVQPTGANPCAQSSAMSEAQMQAGCVAANGQWMGMSVMPSCKMPGMQTGAVPTMQSCSNMRMGWDAANSRCTGTPTTTPGVTDSNSTADCWNESNFARHSSAVCTAARAAANMNNQNNMSGSSDCWNSLNTARFASAECTAMRAKSNDSMKQTPYNQFPAANPCPTYTTPGGATTTAPCGPMNYQPFYNQMGQQTQQVDYNKMYQEQGPFKNFDYNDAMDQFKVNLDQNYDFGKVNAKNEVKRLKNLGAKILSEVTRMQKEEERSIKRAGGLTTCPPIATAQAALSSVKAVGELLKNVTEDNVTDALSAEKQLGFGGGMGGQGPMMQGQQGGFGGGFGGPQGNFGGPQGGFGGGQYNQSFGPQASKDYLTAQAYNDMGSAFNPEDSLWMKAQQAHGQTFMCEGLAHLQSETERFVKEIKSVSKQTKDANLLAKFVALETKVRADSDISKINFADVQQGEDPMSDIMMAMQDNRMEFDDLRQEAMHAGEKGKICDNVTEASTMLPNFKDSISEEEYAFAKVLVNSALDACKTGDIDSARDYLEELFSLGDGNNNITSYDTKQFSKDQAEKLAGDLTAKQLAALTARLDDLTAQLSQANKQIELLSGKVADFATNFALTAAPTVDTKAVFTNIAQLPDVAQTKIIDNIEPVLAAAGDASAALFDEAQLSSGTKAQFDALVNKVVASGLTDNAQKAIVAELDKVVAYATTTDTTNVTEKKALETEVKSFITNAGRVVDGITPADRVKDGIAPTTDVTNMKVWYFAPITEAMERKFVSGNPDGTMTPEKQMNGAEMTCMAARAVLGASAIAAAPTTAIAGVTGPAWANQCFNALSNSGVDVDGMRNALNGSLAGTVARKDAAEFIYAIKGDEIPAAGTTVSGVADSAKLATLSTAEQTAIAALNADGILTGKKQANGDTFIAPADILLKAEGITLFNRLLDNTTTAATQQ